MSLLYRFVSASSISSFGMCDIFMLFITKVNRILLVDITLLMEGTTDSDSAVVMPSSFDVLKRVLCKLSGPIEWCSVMAYSTG